MVGLERRIVIISRIVDDILFGSIDKKSFQAVKGENSLAKSRKIVCVWVFRLHFYI